MKNEILKAAGGSFFYTALNQGGDLCRPVELFFLGEKALV